MRFHITVPLAVILGWTSTVCAETPAELTERFLIEGKLGAGENALGDILKTHPENAEARFGLGTIQFFRAVERAVQSFHRYGLRTGVIMANVIPFARLPIPPNGAPEPISYTNLRTIMQTWIDDLGKAEGTLARIDDKEVKLPLRFGQIRLDMDGDGKTSADETLWKLYVQLNAAARNQVNDEAVRRFIVTFDRGDVAWLRGYCHLLMAMGECFLTYDGQELFNHSAGLFYPEPDTPFAFLRQTQQPNPNGFPEEILDAVAFIHMLRLPVSEPARMKTALAHLESMIALSHESWRFILAETDDDHEWVPNTKQHSVMPGGTVTIEMVKGWLEFLDEAKAILKGEKLIPFWRKGEARGINLRHVFTEPTTFDLVLWIQGTAAAPYLEQGPITKPETWRRFQTIFNGQFIGFAFWFN